MTETPETPTTPLPEVPQAVVAPNAQSVALARRSIATLATQSGWDPTVVAEGHVLIFPAYVRQISDLHQIKLEMVKVAVPTSGARETEDLYTMQGKLAPTKHLLERMSALAGIQWDVERCRFDHLSSDCVIYTAVGGIRGASGTMRWVSATKEWNIEVERMEIDERSVDGVRETGWNQNKRKATPEENAAYRRQELARSIKHRIPMTESKARTRVMRALLGLPGVENAAYWDKPFFLPRIDVLIDATDPETRRLVHQDAFGARATLGYSRVDMTDVEVLSEDVAS